MRKAIYSIGILLVSLSTKSQGWNPEFIASLKDYYFVPVEFESFGDWISGIENDSCIIFSKKIFTQVNDSIFLNTELQKKNLPSPFINSTISNKILGNTETDKQKEYQSGGNYLLKVIDLPPRVVTTLRIYASISFETTMRGRLLAAQAQKKLEDQFGIFFANKKVYQSNKNIHKRKFHPEVERTAYFRKKDELISRFYISTYNLEYSNIVELCITYELDH